jgi:hypothetical protein
VFGEKRWLYTILSRVLGGRHGVLYQKVHVYVPEKYVFVEGSQESKGWFTQQVS